MVIGLSGRNSSRVLRTKDKVTGLPQVAGLYRAAEEEPWEKRKVWGAALHLSQHAPRPKAK